MPLDVIEIIFNEAQSQFDNIVCLIDQEPAVVTRDAGTLTVEKSMLNGVHQLSLQFTNDDQCIEISDVKLNGSSFKETLYLSYTQQPDQLPLQPSTSLQGTQQKWILPFGTPMGFWISLAQKKFANGEFGKNLYEKYNIMYPEILKLSDRFPSAVKSFYEQDFDFIVTARDEDLWKLPVYPLKNLHIDSKLMQSAHEEILLKYQRILPVAGQDHDEKQPANWTKFWVGDESPTVDLNTVVTKNEMPFTCALVDALGLTNLVSIYLGVLQPGGYIKPHMDNHPDFIKSRQGQCYVYLPLNWQPGNHFKVLGGPIFNDPIPYCVNNQGYVHCVVNDSDLPRTVIAVWADANSNLSLIK